MVTKEEFQSDDYEEVNYRYAEICLFCQFIDIEKSADKSNDGGYARQLHFCKKHSKYVQHEKVCDQYT